MRVLQLCKFYPPVRGGMESVVWELTEGLHRQGVDVRVLCANQRAVTVYERAPAGYGVVRASSWGTLLSTSMSPALIGLVRRMAEGVDIVHVHMPDPMAALALRLAAPKARLVVHWHSDVVRQRWAMRLYEPLQRWLLDRADTIVATSPPYAASSKALLNRSDKVRVLPIGIGENPAPADGRRVAALRGRYGYRRIVFALGRMTYYKGFDVLIDAATALPTDAVVLVGGAGELLETHRSTVARRGLTDKVHFLGPITDGDLAVHFEACDAFCMPSTVRAEAYGVAMLEAMAAGRPTVACDIPGSGVPWLNRHEVTGLNVPPGDGTALASALTRMLGDDALRQRLGEAARDRYFRHFTADEMTRGTTVLYRALLDGEKATA